MSKRIMLCNTRSRDASGLKMWEMALKFWNIPYELVEPEELAWKAPLGYGAAIATEMESMPGEVCAALESYVAGGGKCLVSGFLSASMAKRLGMVKVERVQRGEVHRCIRINHKDGLGVWKDREILFFANTANSSGEDYEVLPGGEQNFSILADSVEMSRADCRASTWTGFTAGAGIAIVMGRIGGGSLLHVCLPIGKMEKLEAPDPGDGAHYLYASRNDGVLLLIKSLLDLLNDFEEPGLQGLWPRKARCVVCITGDVHDYTGIPGREDREWQDMLDNFIILREYGLEGKASFYVSGAVAHKHPHVIRQGLGRGFEICSHTYQETQYAVAGLDRQQQQEDINRCLRVFEAAAPGYGCYYKGFRTHGYQSNRVTREILNELGFEYIADMQAWMPSGSGESRYPGNVVNFTAFPQYSEDGNGKKLPLLEIPDTYPNDHFVYRVMKFDPEQALDFWKSEFDRIYRLGGLFQSCLHPYISTKEDPARERTYRKLLEHILQHSDVEFLTMAELCAWWKASRPFAGS